MTYQQYCDQQSQNAGSAMETWTRFFIKQYPNHQITNNCLADTSKCVPQNIETNKRFSIQMNFFSRMIHTENDLYVLITWLGEFSIYKFYICVSVFVPFHLIWFECSFSRVFNVRIPYWLLSTIVIAPFHFRSFHDDCNPFKWIRFSSHSFKPYPTVMNK